MLHHDQHEDDHLPWTVTRLLLQRLYCKEGRVRHAAAKRLVDQVAGGTGLLDDAAIEGMLLRMWHGVPRNDRLFAC